MPPADPGPYVVVWDSREVPGLDRLEDAEEVPWHPVVPLRDALLADYSTDVHLAPLVAYEVPEDGGPLTVPDTYEQPRLNSGAIRPLKEQGVEPLLGAVFIDVDRPHHAAWSSPEEAEEAIQDLLDHHCDEGGVLEKAAVYLTRAGWRAVFVVEPPIPVSRYKAVMGVPYTSHRGDASGLLGWFAEGVGKGVDPSCASPLRCYRAPKVMRDGAPTMGWLDLEGLEEGPLDVTRWLANAKARKEAPSPQLVDLTRPALVPLSPAEWAQAGLEGDLKRRYPSVRGLPSLPVAIRTGRPWFGPGERNDATFDAVSLVLELIFTRHRSNASGQDAADFVFRAMYPCIMAACSGGISNTPGHTALDELWDMIVRRVGVEAARVASLVEVEDRAEAARIAVGTAVAGGGKKLKAGSLKGALADVVDEDDLQDDLEVPVDPDVDDIGLRPLLCFGSGYLVLDARNPEKPRYFPFTKNTHLVYKLLIEGCGDIMSEPGHGPLGLNLYASNGKMRPLQELVIDYGAQITDMVIAHGTEIPVLDIERGRLQVPGAHPRKVAPRFDEQIARWLELLGGDDHEALLDWLATLTRLDYPTCALYMEGHPGTGKGLFATCCTSVFGSGYNRFETAVGRFNVGLKDSPIVFLDEKASLPNPAHASAAFRTLVAETEHRVEPKGQEVQTIRGAMRVIIAANNADALPLVGAHTADDILAVTSRIRWLGISDRAKHYLQEIGGRSTTEAWVGGEMAPGLFAAHVRWLELNRPVVPGDRFLVEGRMREYHEYLSITHDRLRVLHAITRAILSGPNTSKASGVVVEPAEEADDEKLWIGVNAGGLRGKWMVLTGERNVPSQQEITSALTALHGVVPARRNNLRVYLVPMKYLILACGRLGHPEWTVRQNVQAMAEDAQILSKKKIWSDVGAQTDEKAPVPSVDWRKPPKKGNHATLRKASPGRPGPRKK